MQAIPIDADRLPKLQAQDNRTEAKHCKPPIKEGRKKENMPLTWQDTGVGSE